MKNIFAAFLIASLHFCCPGVYAQVEGKKAQFNYVEGADYDTNLILNPSAETDTNFVSASGGTLVRDTSAGNKINGKASFKWTGTALGQTVVIDTASTYPDDLTEGYCEFRGRYKSGSSSYSVQILDASSYALNTAALPSVEKWTNFSVGYPCGAKGTRFPVFKQTVAGTPPAINFGKLVYGAARNIGSISQSYKVGSIFVSGCSWSTSSTSYVNYTATTGCTYSVTGSVLAPTSMIPGFRLPSIKSGSYQFVAVGNFLKSTTTGGSALFRFSDGVRVSRPNQIGLSTASDLAVPTIGATFDYASSQGETTFQIQGTVNNASVGANVNGFEVAVYFFPSSNDLIVSTQNQDSTERILWTPTVTNLGAGSGTFNTSLTYASTNGMNLNLCLNFTKDGTNGSGSGLVSFTPPPGFSFPTVQNVGSGGGGGNSVLHSGNLIFNNGSLFYSKADGNYATGADMVAGSYVFGCINAIPTTSKKPTNGAVIINAVNDMSPVDAFLSSQATTAGTLQKLNIVATVNPSGLFSGGTFTAKEKCNYLVNSGADIGPFSTGPGAFVQTVLAIYKNGAEFRRRNGTSSSVPSPISLSAIVPLNSGETLELYGNPGTGNGNGMGNISMQVIKLPNCN